MATTSPDNIQYPVNSDQVAPLASHFKNLADSTQAALNTKAPLASPALTGTPTGPTAAVDTSTTQLATTAFVTNQAAAATSPMNGTAAVGTSKRYARQDHVHPTDTTRAPLASPTFTGTPAAPTAAADTNTTQVATTAYVVGQASSTSPVMDGTAAAGTSLKYARADHVHPSDTSRSPAAGSSSITTVGTVTSGTWSATDVGLAHGGTNATLTAVNGGVVYSGASAMAITAAGTSGQVLKSNGAAAPTWQTNNLDSLSDVVITSPTAGQTLAYNGTNWINGSGGGGGVTASATAPASPVNGSAWFDTNDGTLYVYYTDANSSQWVEVQADSALGSQLTTRMSTAESNITALQSASPNYIINGGFDIWQRSTSSSGNGAYTSADRWYIYYNAGTTTLSKETSVIPAGFNSAMKITQAAATATMVIYQVVETLNAAYLAGKTVTFSSYLAASASASVKLQVSYSNNVDNSVSGTWTDLTPTVGTGSFSIPTGSTYSRYNITVNVPSTAKSVRIGINPEGLTAGTSVYWTGAQLEVGSTVTSFRRNQPNVQAELAACKRYYQVDTVNTYLNGTNAGLSNSYLGSKAFEVEMRSTPTLYIYPESNLAGVAGKATMYPTGTAQPMNLEVVTSKHFQILYAGVNSYNLGIFTWKAEAEL